MAVTTVEKLDIGGKPTLKDQIGRGRPHLLPVSSTCPSSSTGEPPPSTEEMKLPPTTRSRATKQSKLSTRPQYYNPDPVTRMFGRANEATVEGIGVSTNYLVDTGATVTIVSSVIN